MGDLCHDFKGGSWQGERRDMVRGRCSQQDPLWSKSSFVPIVWPYTSEHKNHFDPNPWHLISFFSLWNNLIREIVLLRKQVTQLGAGKESLLGLVMTSMKSEVLVRSPGIYSVPWPRISPEATGSLGRRKSNEGVDWTAAVCVSISSPLLVSNELFPHLVGNPGWKEEAGCCQGWYWQWYI